MEQLKLSNTQKNAEYPYIVVDGKEYKIISYGVVELEGGTEDVNGFCATVQIRENDKPNCGVELVEYFGISQGFHPEHIELYSDNLPSEVVQLVRWDYARWIGSYDIFSGRDDDQEILTVHIHNTNQSVSDYYRVDEDGEHHYSEFKVAQVYLLDNGYKVGLVDEEDFETKREVYDVCALVKIDEKLNGSGYDVDVILDAITPYGIRHRIVQRIEREIRLIYPTFKDVDSVNSHAYGVYELERSRYYEKCMLGIETGENENKTDSFEQEYYMPRQDEDSPFYIFQDQNDKTSGELVKMSFSKRFMSESPALQEKRKYFPPTKDMMSIK